MKTEKRPHNSPAYCTELNSTQLKQALADGIKEKAASIREFAITKIMESTTPLTHADMVELNRSLFPKNPKDN